MPKPISMRATMMASIPARAIARWASPPAASNGKRAAKIRGEIDESGPRTRIFDGPEDRVADQAPDGRVQAGHGREPGQLRIGQSLRHQDGSEHDAGDDVGPCPPPVVGPNGPESRYPPGYPREDLRPRRPRPPSCPSAVTPTVPNLQCGHDETRGNGATVMATPERHRRLHRPSRTSTTGLRRRAFGRRAATPRG